MSFATAQSIELIHQESPKLEKWGHQKGVEFFLWIPVYVYPKNDISKFCELKRFTFIADLEKIAVQ